MEVHKRQPETPTGTLAWIAKLAGDASFADRLLREKHPPEAQAIPTAVRDEIRLAAAPHRPLSATLESIGIYDEVGFQPLLVSATDRFPIDNDTVGGAVAYLEGPPGHTVTLRWEMSPSLRQKPGQSEVTFSTYGEARVPVFWTTSRPGPCTITLQVGRHVLASHRVTAYRP
ncbi:MAG TPA: hypothetical protein VGO93_10240 [Candidatus Xenobia bacterium]